MAGRGELTTTQREIFRMADAGVSRVAIAKELRLDRGYPGRVLRNPRLRELWKAERDRAALVPVYAPEVVGDADDFDMAESVAIRHLARGRVWRVLDGYTGEPEEGEQ